MYIASAILIVIACVGLIFLVVIQKSKGGGLATNLQGGAALASQMGMRRATDFVEKATWYFIGAIAVLTIVANVALISSFDEGGNIMPESTRAIMETGGAPGGLNSAPAPQQSAPGQQQEGQQDVGPDEAPANQ